MQIWKIKLPIFEKIELRLKLCIVFYQEFGHVMGRTRESVQHEKCHLMSLEYACEFSASLELCTMIYEEFCKNCLIMYLLPCANNFVMMEEYFGKMFSVKVVEDDLN